VEQAQFGNNFNPSIQRIPTSTSVRARSTLDHGKRSLYCCHEQVAEAHQGCKSAAGIAVQRLGSPVLTFYLQELEFLTDSSIISLQQLSSILAQLPAQTPLQAPVHTPSSCTSPTPPVSHFSNINLNEKANYGVVANPAPPPPAYALGPQILSIAVALYAYTPTDTGDLALQQNDRIQVTEHMNNDCKLRARHHSEDFGY
jgi:hypothetical protein